MTTIKGLKWTDKQVDVLREEFGNLLIDSLIEKGKKRDLSAPDGVREQIHFLAEPLEDRISTPVWVRIK